MLSLVFKAVLAVNILCLLVSGGLYLRFLGKGIRIPWKALAGGGAGMAQGSAVSVIALGGTRLAPTYNKKKVRQLGITGGWEHYTPDELYVYT